MADDANPGWRRHLFGPTAPRTAVVLAAILALPFCWTGLFADDYMQQLALEGASNMPATRWDLFTFAVGDPARIQPYIENGPYSWWTLPELKFSFLRPLACALANFDALAFGRAFFFHHLHSLAWYLGLVVVVGALFRRALGAASPVAAIAVILFAIDDSHAVVAGWVANRNALTSGVFALLGVLAHVWWRERRDRRALPISLLACALGLAAGESALSAIAYLLAYELTAGPGTWRTRVAALLPLAVLGVSYIALYKALGSGAWGSEIYVDPIREPLRFLALAPPKALALIGAQFLGASADLWMVMIASRPALAAAGVLALVVMGALLRKLWPRLTEEERRGLRWLSVGAALSLVPVLATFPLNRLLLMPSIGGSALLAAVLWHGWKVEGDRLLRAGTRVLFFTTVVVALLAWPASALAVWFGAKEMTRTSLELEVSDHAMEGRVFVFVAPDPTASLYVPLVRKWNHKPASQSWVTISFAPYAHRLTRTAADTVELEVIEGRMLQTVFEQLMRSAAFPVPLGMKVRLAGAEVTVIGLEAGLPNKVRVRFDQDPELGGYTLAKWQDGTLKPLVLPPVGQTMELPRQRGLMAL